MKHLIILTNEQSKLHIGFSMRRLIRRAICAALNFEDFTQRAEVSVTVTDDEGIRALNRTYREKDAPTDVLSFPLFDEAGEADGGAVVLGDIVLSAERALAQAQEYGHSVRREIAFLCVHSMLHLLGYDHETSKEDEDAMFSRQEAILEAMGLGRKQDRR